MLIPFQAFFSFSLIKCSLRAGDTLRRKGENNKRRNTILTVEEESPWQCLQSGSLTQSQSRRRSVDAWSCWFTKQGKVAAVYPSLAPPNTALQKPAASAVSPPTWKKKIQCAQFTHLPACWHVAQFKHQRL